MGKKTSALSAGIALACAACLPVVGAVSAIAGAAAALGAALGAIPFASIGFLAKLKLLAMLILGKMIIGAKGLGSKWNLKPNWLLLKNLLGLGWESLGGLLAGLKGLNLNCNQYGGDPVNLATGNFIYEKEYLKIKGLFPLSFRIFYNAQEKRKNALGYGWAHGFEAGAHKEGHAVTIFLDDGKQEVFIGGHQGRYVHSQGQSSTLCEQDSYLVYQNQGAIKYIFNSNGKLIRKEDKNANYLRFSYDGQGKLLKAANNSNSSFEFSYNGDKLKQVRDNTGRTVSFEYRRDVLTCLTDENKAKHKFAYDKQKALVNIINPLGINILSNEYDENFRIKKQGFPDGGLISYEYKDDEKKLILTEQNGNQVTYIHDGRFRSVATVYADGTETYDYNAQNLRTLHTDKKGNSTKYSYDDRSKLIKIVNPLDETIDLDYNEQSRLVRIKLGGDIIQQASYDDQGNATGIKDALDRESKIKYNSNNQPLKIIKADGSEINIEYDRRGNILTVTEPSAKTRYEYDKLNRVIATIDGNGSKTGYEYNAKGDITKVINALGDERIYEYNAAGKVTRIEDFDGSESMREYNCLGKPGKLIDPEGNETKLEYDLMGNLTKRIDANGNATVFDYDMLHHLEKITNPLGDSIHYTYDPNGNRTAITGARGEQIFLSYDALNRVTKVTGANGAVTKLSYNRRGQITSATNALGQESIFSYDKAGQRIADIDPAGKKTEYAYTLLGQIREIKDPAGRKTTYEYLPGGLLEKMVFPDGTSVKYTYDQNKNIISQTAQDGYALYYEYDCLNRITKISSNSNQEEFFSYDPAGNVTTVTDANGAVTKYVYSPNRNLLAVIDPLGQRTEYDYDKLNNLVEVKQLAKLDEAQRINTQNSDLHITKYVRDQLGRVEKISDALGNTETYSYDEAGNLVAKLDKEGYLTKYAFDPANQLQEVVYADGKSVKLSYNPLKQLTEIKDWLGVTAIEVDELGRAKKVTDHNGKKVEYSFGSAGERREIIYPDGKTVNYEYDDLLRLKTLICGDDRAEYVYDENSRLSRKTFSNGLSTDYSYNDAGLLCELAHSDKDGILDKYRYTYDSMFNKTGIEKYRRDLAEESGQYRYAYDALSRLTDVLKDDKLIKKFAYDEFGNRSFMLDQDIRTDYTYNPLNQLVQAKSTERRQDFAYDARGNLRQVGENGRLRNSYEFNPLNRLTRAANSDGEIAVYEYNSLGQRVGKRITAGWDPLHLADNPGSTKNISYVLDLTKQYHNLLQESEDGQAKNYAWDFDPVVEYGEDSHFYLLDDLGSPLRLSDADGALLDSYAYDEFGNDLTGNQGATQPFGFTGYRYDNVAQTYFAQAREYNPQAGRFCSADLAFGTIFRPLSLNGYIYCLNNPKTHLDLNGRDPTTTGGGSLDYYPYWLDKIEKGNDAHVTLRQSLGVAQTPGLQSEVYIYTGLQAEMGLPYSTPSGSGFADYVLFSWGIGEVYELKPDTAYGNTQGPKQTASYAQALNNNGQYLGTMFAPGTMTLSAFNVTLPSSRVEGRTITYWQNPLVPGMVYYTINDPPKEPATDPVIVPVPEKEKEGEFNIGWEPAPAPAYAASGWDYALLAILGIWAIASPDPLGEVAFFSQLCLMGL